MLTLIVFFFFERTDLKLNFKRKVFAFTRLSWLVGRSVCHNSLKGFGSYTCYKLHFHAPIGARVWTVLSEIQNVNLGQDDGWLRAVDDRRQRDCSQRDARLVFDSFRPIFFWIHAKK